jgi:Secretion system C-terminal sorting domain
MIKAMAVNYFNLNEGMVLLAKPIGQNSQWSSPRRVGQITLEYALNKTETGEVVIYNIQGIAMQSYQLNNQAKRMTTVLNLTPGIYILKYLVNDKFVISTKLIVE